MRPSQVSREQESRVWGVDRLADVSLIEINFLDPWGIKTRTQPTAA